MIDINWAAFTPISALIGGACIGLAAAVLILGIGQILGMSGIAKSAVAQIVNSSLSARKSAVLAGWQWVFILGMAVATWLYMLLIGFPEFDVASHPLMIVLAGLLVGFGTRLGSGCTSGHGVCGLSRFSPRSLVATLAFMAGGIITASVVSFLTSA